MKGKISRSSEVLEKEDPLDAMHGKARMKERAELGERACGT